MTIIQPISANKGNFTWKDNHGVSMASDLGYLAGHPPYERVYDDACDVGLLLQGRNSKILFIFDDFKDDAWHFTSTCKRFTLQIFND